MNKFKRTVVFSLILLAVLFGINENLAFTDELGTKEIFHQFYSQPENSIDGVYFGNSATQRAWLAPKAYHDYGITVFNLATASQPIGLTKYLMCEVEKTQSPKLYIIDLRSILRTPDNLTDSAMRRVTDNLKESKNRFSAIKYMLTYAAKGDNNIDTTDKSYYIKLMKYHSLWDSSKRPGHLGIEYLQGFAYYDPVYYNIKALKNSGYTSDKKSIPPVNEDVLNDILDNCDKSDADVLFLISPCEAVRDELLQFNYIQEIVTKRGYPVLNFFDEDLQKAIKFDYSKSCYNERHMNCYGAMNYTDYLAKYIDTHYNLPDRRTEAPKEWEDAYLIFKERTTDKYNEMLVNNDLTNN